MDTVTKSIVKLACIWVIAIGCICVMKKIQPDTWRLYLIYAIAVCGAITGFVIWLLHASGLV